MWEAALLILAILVPLFAFRKTQKTDPNCPPGPTIWPIIGNYLIFWQFWRSGIPLAATRYAQKYGDVVCVYLLGEKTILISSPELAKHVLSTRAKNYVTRPAEDYGLVQLGMFNNGIIWNNDTKRWEYLRKFFQKALTHKDLKNAANIAVSITKSVCNSILSKKTGVDLMENLRLITFGVTTRLFFGLEWDEEKSLDAVRKIVAYFKAWEFFLITPKFLYLFHKNKVQQHRKAIHELNEVSANFIAEKRKEVIKNSSGATFLDELLKAQSKTNISESELQQCVLEMLLAGTDTSSVTMFYLLISLSENPNIELDVVHELAVKLGGHDYKTDLKLPNLDIALAESLRIKPVGPVIMRKAIEDDQLGPYSIAKGTNIIINLAHMNLNKNRFLHPENFCPREHFSGGATSHAEEFFPFGEGPKGCVGQHLAKVEIAAVLATLLPRVKVVSGQTLNAIDTHWDIAQQPTNQIYVTCIPREPPNKVRIFLCGAHSTGKTTLLREVQKEIPSLQSLSEVARELMTKMNINRDDLEIPEKRVQFQRKLIRLQCKKEEELDQKGDDFISDRSAIDGVVYARKYVGQKLEEELLATPAAKKCLDNYRNRSLIFIVEPHEKCMVDDHIRKVPQSLEELQDFTQIMRNILDSQGVPYTLISELDLRKRVQFVSEAYNNYKRKIPSA